MTEPEHRHSFLADLLRDRRDDPAFMRAYAKARADHDRAIRRLDADDEFTRRPSLADRLHRWSAAVSVALLALIGSLVAAGDVASWLPDLLRWPAFLVVLAVAGATLWNTARDFIDGAVFDREAGRALASVELLLMEHRSRLGGCQACTKLAGEFVASPCAVEQAIRNGGEDDE